MTIARTGFWLAPAALAILTACSQPAATPGAADTKQALEPISGQTALYQMYRAARSGWALDVLVLKVNSIRLSDPRVGEIPDVPGKSPAWEAVFSSPSLAAARAYTDCVFELLPDFHKGAFAGPVQTYAPSRHGNTPFLIAAVKTDTDAAYQTALTKAAADVKRNAGKPVSFVLELSERFPNPAWRIVWGDSVATSTMSVFVDASTGQFLETIH